MSLFRRNLFAKFKWNYLFFYFELIRLILRNKAAHKHFVFRYFHSQFSMLRAWQWNEKNRNILYQNLTSPAALALTCRSINPPSLTYSNDKIWFLFFIIFKKKTWWHKFGSGFYFILFFRSLFTFVRSFVRSGFFFFEEMNARVLARPFDYWTG